MNIKEEFSRFKNWLIDHRDSYESILSEKPYCLEIKHDNVFGRDLVLFKYNQIESDFNEPFVKLCRGLVLDAHSFDPVVFPFVKFHNAGEKFADKIDWESAHVDEKVDGCVSYDTMIKTTIGDVKIEEICKNPDEYEILTFNHQNNQIESAKIDAFDIKPNINNWYRIELENGAWLNITGNHRIWCENLQCYRRIDQLDGTEDVIFK